MGANLGWFRNQTVPGKARTEEYEQLLVQSDRVLPMGMQAQSGPARPLRRNVAWQVQVLADGCACVA
jgi:hypothetical protein